MQYKQVKLLTCLTAALHPRPPNGSHHQDPALREESRHYVSSNDLLLPGMLDTLRYCVHDGSFRQEKHGLSNSGHHPIVLCQVQHSLQPPHLCIHEPKGV